jgi:hypothetical protein
MGGCVIVKGNPKEFLETAKSFNNVAKPINQTFDSFALF